MGLKANELRYGNKLLFLGDVVTFKNITEIREDGIFWIKTFEPKIESKNFHFKPIPLTEEWLLKFGFEIEELYEYNKAKKEDVILTYGENFFYNTTTIKYVHQLQNLFFALTNKELEIKM